MNIVNPIGKPTVVAKAANVSGHVAKGAALATLILKDIEARAVKGKRFLVDISELDNPGRETLRVAFTDYLKQFRDEAKQWKGTEQEPLFKSRNNVLAARTSEYVTFSKACDAGWSPDFNDGYAEVLAAARCFLASTASMASVGPDGEPIEPVGPKARVGRKSLSNEERFVRYLEKMEPTMDDLKSFGKIIAATIKAAKDADDAIATAKTNEGALIEE